MLGAVAPHAAASVAARAATAGAAAVRLGFAVAFLADPDIPARALHRRRTPGMRRVARAVAVRELVLGTGTALALLRGRPAAGWVAAMAVADAVNGTATLLAGARGLVPVRRALAFGAFDLSGTVTELALLRTLRQCRPTDTTGLT